MSEIKQRKLDHIVLCEGDEVEFKQKTQLLEQVQLVHDALPELALEEVDLSVEFAGRPLRAPLILAAMTGGVQRAEAINRDLAQVAEEYGIGFGFGSQRPLLEKGTQLGYQVRDVAPTTLILGNLGAVQLRDYPLSRIQEMVQTCGLDALCIHLNPAMELVQPGGDTDFRGCLDAIAQLAEGLSVPVVAKETGCGLSRSVGERLVERGVRWVDVSGAGGTSWVGVETLRGGPQELGQLFWDWGIPTGGSVAQLSGLPLGSCATGGVASGMDALRALALGARCAGSARPFLQAWSQGGIDAVRAKVEHFLQVIRVGMLLCGARDCAALQQRPLLLGASLRDWVPKGSPLERRLASN